jgi:hypothetical protein
VTPQRFKTRAQLAMEPRVMQFVLERPCPESDAGKTYIPDHAPVPILVLFPAERRSDGIDGGHNCSEELVYRVVAESAQELFRQVLGREHWPGPGRYFVVCGKMGHLIE